VPTLCVLAGAATVEQAGEVSAAARLVQARRRQRGVASSLRAGSGRRSSRLVAGAGVGPAGEALHEVLEAGGVGGDEPRLDVGDLDAAAADALLLH